MLMRCLLIISLSVKLIAIISKWHETQHNINIIKCANEMENEAENYWNSFIVHFTLRLRWFLQRPIKWKILIRFIINVIIMEIMRIFFCKKGKNMFLFLSAIVTRMIAQTNVSKLGWSLNLNHMQCTTNNKVFFYSVYVFFCYSSLTIFLVNLCVILLSISKWNKNTWKN